jgi:tetratricopeptide (TPR) repeat protein
MARLSDQVRRCCSLGAYRAQRGEADDALREYQKAEKLAKRLIAGTTLKSTAFGWLAMSYDGQSRFAEAERAFRKAFEIFNRYKAKEVSPEWTAFSSHYTVILDRLGRHDEAEQMRNVFKRLYIRLHRDSGCLECQSKLEFKWTEDGAELSCNHCKSHMVAPGYTE